MHYWNQENFKGLKDIGEKYALVNGYEDFAKYCILKEKGIRKVALKAIDDFILASKEKSQEVQREISVEIVSLSYHNRSVHQLIPNQLQRYLLTTLRCWVEENPSIVMPYRWLGVISKDMGYFEQAIQIDSQDEISIIELINHSLSNVDYQTHHLCESAFIGTVSDAQNSLEKIVKLLERLENDELKDNLFKEYQYFRRLINRWIEYKQEKGKLSFIEWVENKGEHFNFWNIVYYNS